MNRAVNQTSDRNAVKILSPMGALKRRVSLTMAMGVLSSVMLLIGVQIAAAEDEKIITAHGIATFGELGYGPDFAHLDYVNPDAPKGGEFSMSVAGRTFDNVNPYTRKGSPAVLASVMFETLLVGTLDEVGTNYGLLAHTIEYPESRDWVIFHMRPEARFSDGSPLTAHDVVFSFELLRDDGLISFRSAIKKRISGAEVLDDHRVKFTFVADAERRDLIQTAGGLPVYQKAWYEESGAKLDETRLVTSPGSGPYVMDLIKPGERITYKLNPDYWGKDLPINIGQNNYGSLRFEYFGDTNAAFEAFKAGEFTFRNETSSKNWATGYDFPGIKRGDVVKAELPNGNVASGQAFVFNLRNDKFDDIRVREAIGLMFNFEWTNRNLFYDLYARIDSFWDNSDLEAQGAPEGAELAVLNAITDELPAGILTDVVTQAPVSTAERSIDRKNLRKASQLLDAAGWIVGDDGLRRNAAGDTLDIEILERSPSFDRVVLPFIENLRAVGVNATYERVDASEYSERQQTFDYDMITTHLGNGLLPGAGLMQRFGTESAEESIFNPAGYASPAVDGLIEQIMAADSREELNVVAQAMDRVLRAEYLWVPQWFKDVHTVSYFDMYEHPEELPPFGLGELSIWWVNPDKLDALKASGALR